MDNMLARGSEFLARKRKAHASTLVQYERQGRPSIEIDGTHGRRRLELDRGDFGQLVIESEDWVVTGGDLLVEAEATPPVAGDRIVETIGKAQVTYEVLDLGDAPPWKWCDGFRNSLRIHTKVIDTKSV